MKKVTKTQTTEHIYYEAIDGTLFSNEEECRKYEKSAEVVLYGMIKDKVVGITTPYGLLGTGYDDNLIYIYKVDSMETLELLNRYIYLKTEIECLLNENMIGKDVLVEWSYDEDGARYYGSIEDYCTWIKTQYSECLKKYSETKK